LSFTPGTRLGSYEIVAALGSGGMGEVYRARDVRLGRDVAVKVMASRLAGDDGRLHGIVGQGHSRTRNPDHWTTMGRKKILLTTGEGGNQYLRTRTRNP